jgi:glycerol dehydrogenase-like iron-containing ADH family enzyme
MVGMDRKYTRHVHVKMTEDLYKKAKQLAEQCCEGRISQLVRKLIEEEYEEVFGKGGGRA